MQPIIYRIKNRSLKRGHTQKLAITQLPTKRPMIDISLAHRKLDVEENKYFRYSEDN